MTVRVRGQDLEVDIRAELEQYEWRKARWTPEKLIACSPFRHERKPSFAVRLDNGVWIDSGAYEVEWRQGSFVKLLSYLRNETERETEDYLLALYGCHRNDSDLTLENMHLDLTLERPEARYLDLSILREYAWRHPYLERDRGLGEEIQRRFKVGYCRKSRAVTFPWFDRRGRLVNIKFRSVYDKRFWYHPEGQPIRNHLYGIHAVHAVGAEEVWVVESEIDALTLWQAGKAAVALGGARFTEEQRRLLLQTPVKIVIVATDNDKAGQQIARGICDSLGGYLEIKKMHWLDSQCKDINELLLTLRDDFNDFLRFAS